MKIAYLSNGYTTHDDLFIKALDSGNHDIYFISLYLKDKSVINRSIDSDHVFILENANYSTESITDSLRKIFRSISPDLVHSGPLTTCGYFANLTDFQPLIVMSWGYDILIDYNTNSENKSRIKTALDNCSGFICDSKTIYKKSQEISSNINRIESLIIPWGTEPEIFFPNDELSSVRGKLGWQNNIVILSNRAWEPIYKIDIVLESFLYAYHRDSKLRLILIGSGSQAEFVKTFIKNNHLEDVCFLPGRLNHNSLPDYYNASDIYLSCSESDGTSVSLLEALSTDLLPIVTNIESNEEWVQHNSNGYLGELNNSVHFGNCILNGSKCIIEKTFFWKTKNREIAVNRANWKLNVISLLNYYESIKIKNPLHR